MIRHTPYEAELLVPAEQLVDAFVRSRRKDRIETRFQLLEAVASRLGGFSLSSFNAQFGIRPIADQNELLEHAKHIVSALERSQVVPALALSALAREQISDSERRSSGAYHTDFRLAQRLALLVTPKPKLKAKVIDPACGAGMLLVALALHVCGPDRKKMARWLSESVYASDQSPVALRGALLSLAALTSDVSALASMRENWIVGDSLLAPESQWRSLASGGFDIVIANPPWEKVKLSRHEFKKSNGDDRHYGAHTGEPDTNAFRNKQASVALYAGQLSQRYPLLAKGEPDLYVAFTELFGRLCKPGGTIAALLPGGLIRSQGTEALRRHLLGMSSHLTFSIIENRARFFGIDTRFKFLAIASIKQTRATTEKKSITLLHERGVAHHLEQFGKVKIGRESLVKVRPDLSVPEVKSILQWRIFRHMMETGESWGHSDSPWSPAFCREVDMTKERPTFQMKRDPGGIPLVEGRMVQQHRFGAKKYVNGSGRRALWQMLSLGDSTVAPQFFISKQDVPASSRARVDQLRVGFCDITGQTNERSVMAALIPAGVVCGNKVPTILFPNDPTEERMLAWCAIVNSLPFDWLARRIITTTINYFLLVSLALPRLVKDGLPWRRLVAAARELRSLDTAGSNNRILARAAKLRAFIDAEIAVAYGLKFEALVAMMDDFPLLDRGQPALLDEERSTITKDFMLLTAAKRMKRQTRHWAARVEAADKLGAIAYVTSEAPQMTPDELRSADAQ